MFIVSCLVMRISKLIDVSDWMHWRNVRAFWYWSHLTWGLNQVKMLYLISGKLTVSQF